MHCSLQAEGVGPDLLLDNNAEHCPGVQPVSRLTGPGIQLRRGATVLLSVLALSAPLPCSLHPQPRGMGMLSMWTALFQSPAYMQPCQDCPTTLSTMAFLHVGPPLLG